jgi:photosystem II stability/assembly factor-like uncharacterized protein
VRPLSTLLLLFVALPVSAAEWEAITTELLKAEKPGYGGLCSVVVDHATGDLIVNLSDKGLYRSTDHGKTWAKLGPVVKGRTEWPGCLMLDPTGKSKRVLMALVYGAPIGLSMDGGATWKQMDKKSEHVDWASIDWTDPDAKFVLTLKHESGGLLMSSHDGGKSFTDVGKGYGPAWVFDGQTGVVAEMKSKDHPKPRILRTSDGGKTWDPVGDLNATAMPKWRDGTLYWLSDNALMTTRDQGKTWSKIADIKEAQHGPIFGKDDKHFFVLTKAGIIESTDAGLTWSKPIALPKDLKGVAPLTWFDYDPKGDVLYLMKMGTELFRMGKK